MDSLQERAFAALNRRAKNEVAGENQTTQQVSRCRPQSLVKDSCVRSTERNAEAHQVNQQA